MLLQVTIGYYMLLHVTIGYYRLIYVTTEYYKLLQFTTEGATICTRSVYQKKIIRANKDIVTVL